MAIRFYLTVEYRRKMRGLRPLSEEFFCVLSVYYLGVLSAFAFLGIIKSCSEDLTAEYAEKNARREH